MPRISRKSRNVGLAKARQNRWAQNDLSDSASGTNSSTSVVEERIIDDGPSTSSGIRASLGPIPRSRASSSSSEDLSAEIDMERIDIPLTARPYSTPSPEPRPVTRLEKKIEMMSPLRGGEDVNTEEVSNQDLVTIVEMKMVTAFVSLFRCPTEDCNSTIDCRVNTSKRKGFAMLLEAYCSSCESVVASSYTSDVDESAPHHPKPFTVNRNVVLASLRSDMGPHKLSNFCESLSMPSVHKKTFTKKTDAIYGMNMEVSERIFAQSVAAVKKEHERQLGATLDPVEPLEIAVSFDGTWMTRGHSSLIGIGCAIDTLTGLVVDAHVVSAFCQTCATTGKWQKKNMPHRYDQWLAAHQIEGCNINFTGTSGMMESAAAEVLWNRSIERHQLKYTVFVGDGDSKAFDRVNRSKPYGDREVEKEECMNHVSKRLGTALRNLVSDSSKKGITLGGRKHGSLTGNAIDKLSKYFGRAIQKHDETDDMRNAIFASLFHCYSTDDNPQHRYCPSDAHTWCFYKKAIAQGQFPGSHKLRVHTPLDQERLHQHVLPVYERLTDNSLLRKCKRHVTQNANESLHHVIWARCTKTLHHSAPRVTFSMLSAVAEFNGGPQAALDMASFYGTAMGDDSKRLQGQRLHKRLQRSISTTIGKERIRKAKRTAASKKAEEEAIRETGGVGYGAGKY